MGSRDTKYAGGFVLLEKIRIAEALSLSPQFIAANLPGNFELLYDPSRRISTCISGEDFVIVFGNWANGNYSLEEEPETADHLLKTASDSVTLFEQELDFLTGRYVVIIRIDGELYVYRDGFGRSIYYGCLESITSSHLNLVAALTKAEPIEELRLKNIHWAMDETSYMDIRTLLPNFRMNMKSRLVRRYFPSQENRFSDWTSEEKYSEVERLWSNQNEQLFARYPRIVMSLTGGMDSRLMLAMTKAYWEKMEYFTYGLVGDRNKTFWQKTMTADYRSADPLVEQARLAPYHKIDLDNRKPLTPYMSELIAANTPQLHGAQLIPHYRELFEGDDWLHIRGHGPEIWRSEPSPDITFDEAVRFTSEKWPNKSLEEFRERAETLGYDRPFGFNIRTLMYWELRLGKWAAEIANETDPAFDTCYLSISRRMIEILLSFPRWERVNGIVLMDLIDRNAPELNLLGYNSPTNLYRSWRKLKRNSEDLEQKLSIYFEQEKNSTQFFDVRILDDSGRVVSEQGSTPQLQIPKKFFQENFYCEGTVYTPSAPGSLTFVLLRNYKKAAGRGKLLVQVCIDGDSMLSFDGADVDVPVSVVIENLRGPEVVTVRVECLADMQGLASWETATKTFLSDAHFYPKDCPSGSLVLRSTIPNS